MNIVNTAANITARDQLVMQWEQAKKASDNAIALERTLRTQVVDLCFPADTRKVGTNNLDLGRGVKLKAVTGLRYTLDKADDAARTNAAVDAIEQTGNEGEFIAERLVKWKPELSVSEYKKLDMTNPTHKRIKDIIDGVLTITPESAQVEIIYPNA